MKITKYNYSALQKRFPEMSRNAVRLEYARILNDIHRLYNAHIDENVKYSFLEPLEDARTFLEGYMAQAWIANCGFYQRSDGEWCYNNEFTGEDVLH